MRVCHDTRGFRLVVSPKTSHIPATYSFISHKLQLEAAECQAWSSCTTFKLARSQMKSENKIIRHSPMKNGLWRCIKDSGRNLFAQLQPGLLKWRPYYVANFTQHSLTLLFIAISSPFFAGQHLCSNATVHYLCANTQQRRLIQLIELTLNVSGGTSITSASRSHWVSNRNKPQVCTQSHYHFATHQTEKRIFSLRNSSPTSPYSLCAGINTYTLPPMSKSFLIFCTKSHHD